jgi:hypothetical protein
MKLARLSLPLVVLMLALTTPEVFGGGKGKSGILSFNPSLSAEGCDYVYTCSNGSSGTCCTGLTDCCATCDQACHTTCGGLCPAT